MPAGHQGGAVHFGPDRGDLLLQHLHEAEDLRLGEHVALKTIRPEITRDQRFVERFKRDEHAAKVRANGVEDERAARVAEGVRDAGRFQRDLFHFLGDFDRAFQGRGIR